MKRENFENLLSNVRNEKFGHAELLKLYDNAMRYPDIEEEEREELTAEIEIQMRKRFAAKATATFGPRDAKAREMLTRVLDAAKAEFDLSNNRLKNTVKTGGDVIKGEMHVQSYISYKNERNEKVEVCIEQITAEDPTTACFIKSVVGGDDSVRQRVDLDPTNFDELTAKYLEGLRQVT